MPVRRTRRTRRPRMRRGTAGKALKMVRSLAPFVDKELHHRDFLSATLPISTTVSFVLLSGMPEGVTSTDRLGVQVTLRTLAYKMIWEVGNVDSLSRVTLFRDNAGNGDTPNAVELFETTTAPQQLSSPINNDFVRRFKVLQDYTVAMSPAWKPIVGVKKFRRLGNIQRHQGPGNLATDLQKGGIWMAIQSNTAGGANAPTVSFVSRIRFAP